MGPYYGDKNPNDIIYMMWDSNDSAGASITRGTNGTISVYKDDNTTQSISGVTDVEDFDGTTGIHGIKIDTSSDGTFYAAGHDFHVVLTGAVIDGQSVNAVLGSFSIQNRSPLRPTTAGRTLDVASTGEAGLDFDNIKDASGSHTLTNITVPTVTTTATATAVTTVNGLAANVITATSINTGAITNAKFAAGAIDAAAIAADAIGASELASDAANEIADALLDRAAGVETSWTVRQAMRIILAALAGKLNGADTATHHFRDQADTKNRITATVDATGRTAVTLDAS